MRWVPEEPTKAMLKAARKAMSPGARPTPEWVSNSEKHAIRYRAMIAAAPRITKDRESPWEREG